MTYQESYRSRADTLDRWLKAKRVTSVPLEHGAINSKGLYMMARCIEGMRREARMRGKTTPLRLLRIQ